MLQVGDPAPDFTLPDAEGTPTRLADFRGQRVVLYFYPKDNTPGCTKEACGFRDTFLELEAQNTVVLGISPDGATAHQKFRAKYDLPFRLLSDPEFTVATTYGSYGLKKFMGREYLGVMRQTYVIGADGCIEKIYRKVKPETHAQEILASLS
jgi:peroxiredoxin Q/BCP